MENLLIVDNSIVIINVLKDLFEKKKEFNVEVAKSLKEANELIKKYNFFASISNVVLSDALNGELLNLFHQNKIPTIVLTSNLDDNTINIIRKANIVDYISKDSIYELNLAHRLINLLHYIQGMEILLVDDSPVILSKLKNILETLLLKVHIAKNGKKALELIKDNSNISLMITDHNMDEMDGLELIKNVRKIENYSQLPILIMTTEESDSLKIKFFKNGAFDFLLKPVLEEELKSKIVNIFSNMKQITEIKQYTHVINDHVITSTTDISGNITYVSDAFCEISGYLREEFLGKTHRLVRHPDMPKSLFKELWSTISSGNIWRGEVKNLRKDGSHYWVKAVVHPNLDRKGNIKGYTSIRQDITDKKRIYELSITDGLTSLFNRRYFNELAPTYLDEISRDKKVFAFILLDIDNFKKYNDTYGHQKGDDVLINVAKTLQETFKRSDDKVFRLGGEEFGVLLSAKSVENLLKLAENARINIEKLGIKHEKNPPLNLVTASFGLYITESIENYDIQQIYKQTDELLYAAKEKGRNVIKSKIA